MACADTRRNYEAREGTLESGRTDDSRVTQSQIYITSQPVREERPYTGH